VPDLPKLDVVIANNFGHLPMFIGAEKGYFKQHGVDASFKVVDTGTDMVNALHDGLAQVGDMSTTTYLKAVHAGNPFLVIGLIMNDATRDNADDPLAIVTKKGRGIKAGNLNDLIGKKIGLARGQTSDEYFKMVLRRAKIKYTDLTIENIWSQFGLAPALAEGKVDAIVSWEPYVSQALTHVPDSYEVIRGGQHMSYVMVAVAHGPTVEAKPTVIKSIAAGLAQSSHFTRTYPDEAWRFSPNGCPVPTLPSVRRRSATSASIRACRRKCCALLRTPRMKCWSIRCRAPRASTCPACSGRSSWPRSRRNTRNISPTCRSWRNARAVVVP
jgi:ABC-type nitrate/sulfonate/bicarbonate transport system substrate-binding protein